MLNLQIEIRGDLDNNTRIQARGVVAALVAVFGPAVLPDDRTLSVTQSVGAVSVTTIGDADVVKAATTAPASDGYPTEEPSAAQAFGGQPPVTNDHVATGATQFTGAEVAASATERDSEGIPWDERIHASTKTTNKDGTWTRRRNTPDATFDAVMAELKAANTQRTLDAAAAMTTAPAVAVPVPPTPSVPAPPTSAESPAPSPAPAAPAASSSAPAVPAPPTAASSFPQIMMKVTKAQTAGKVTPEAIKNLLMSIGAAPDANGNYGIIALNKQPDLIPAFDALLEDHIN